MMNKKQFCVNDLVKYNYSDIGEYIDENHTDRPLRNDEVCDLLNEQQSIIRKDETSIKTMMFNMEKLEEKNEQLRKDKEILKERLRECRMKMDKFNCR